MKTERDTAWENVLDRRELLPLNPNSPIAIKRDYHTFDIDAPAPRVASAFHEAMIDTSRRFGLVQVLRKRESQGKPFTLGERFQGCFRIRNAIQDGIDSNPLVGRALRPVQPSLGRLYRRLEDQIHFVEDGMCSDFGEIVELDLDGEVARLKYVYLQGSLMAGSSTFIVEPTSPTTCRITQIFEYQEIRQLYALWLTTSVLKMHLGVVFSQVEQAAEIAGGRIVATSVPEEYWHVGRPSSAPPPNVAIGEMPAIPPAARLPVDLHPHRGAPAASLH